MRDPIIDLQHEKIIDILDTYDIRHVFERIKKAPDESKLRSALSSHITNLHYGKKSVLGIDIRKYGSFDDFEQPLIPILYQILFEEAIQHCLTTQEFTFQDYDLTTIKAHTISTGDGAFIIFDTPLHSILFACSFAITLRMYNSYHLYPKLRAAIGEINLRYAVTYDRMYKLDGNYYGRAVINNSRIINKDNLNRCLIDEGSFQWFQLNIDGMENLQVMGIREIADIEEFQNYKNTFVTNGENTFFEEKENTRNLGIINSDILKIGIIHSKSTELNVYNVHLQVSLNISTDDNLTRSITVSLGNLNTTGI